MSQLKILPVATLTVNESKENLCYNVILNNEFNCEAHIVENNGNNNESITLLNSSQP